MASICIGGLAALLTAEGVCRLLPVATGAKATPVNSASPVFRFTPDREYVWSKGWRFSTVNRGRINNDGFVNDQDYEADDPRPLLAVIGDSYVEALMVPYPQTLQGRIQRCVGAAGRVYSFAASGAPLSQYLVWADYVRERYAAQAMAFVIVGNDFDESLSKYKTGPGFHHFTSTSDGTMSLERYDYSPSTLRKIGRSSALVRYLVLNLHIQTSLEALRAGAAQPARTLGTAAYVGNTAAEASDERLRDSELAVTAFFEELPRRTALEPERVVFLMDGVRPQLYEGEDALDAIRDAYFPRMRELFMREARARGYAAVDLQPLFVTRHQSDGVVFEFVDDAHWSSLGHEVAAQALLGTRAVRELFPMGSPVDGAARPDDCHRSSSPAQLRPDGRLVVGSAARGPIW